MAYYVHFTVRPSAAPQFLHLILLMRTMDTVALHYPTFPVGCSNLETCTSPPLIGMKGLLYPILLNYLTM